MQTRTRLIWFLLVAEAVFLFACKKKDGLDSPDNGVGQPVPVNTVDTTTALRSAAKFPIGVAISYTPMLTDPQYTAIVKRDFSSVTFDYHMKHGAIVKNDGTLDFARADELVNAANSLEIFGHTLGWHQNQNATFLKTYTGLVQSLSTELLSNPGFESGLADWSIFNSGNPAGNATITTTNNSNEVHEGIGAMKVVNPTSYNDNQWRVQVASQLVPTIVGKQYMVSYWVKAASANGSIRLSTQGGTALYQGDQSIGTAWQKITWIFTADVTQTRFLFDMGRVANTYYIDDASIKEVQSPAPGGQTTALLDQALGNFITGIINHYKGKVKAWDVVNEILADNGAIRNNTNTPSTASDVFVWSHYLGKDFALKAFNYAKAADPTATLYINDYNLESNATKLDALIALVTELKGKGAKIDGVGTQMHMSVTTPKFGIDEMFKKLAALGLKVRVSELDITTGNGGTPGTPPGPAELANQAAMYKYVVDSYLKYVPEAQRGGITVWGLTDNTSWLYNNGAQYPLLYDQNYTKKPSYASFLQALKGF